MNSILGIDPDQAGLAQAASVIGQLSGPQRMPVGLGSILGQAAGGVSQARNAATMQQAQLQQMKDASEAKQAAVAEQQRKQQAAVKFNSILGSMEDPSDPASILGAGIKSGAFGPAETTQFLGQVMERRNKRESDIAIAREKLADAKTAREDRERLQRELQDKLLAHQKETKTLIGALRTRNQQLTLDENGYRVVVNEDGTTKYLTGPDGKPMKAPPSGGNRPPPGEVMRMNIALEAMDKALDSYDELLTRFNPRDVRSQTPSKRAETKSLIAALQLEWKEAAALGALTGPDLEMMEKAIVDPATVMGSYYGTKGLENQSKQAREYIKRRKDSIRKFYPNVEGDGGKKDPWE